MLLSRKHANQTSVVRADFSGGLNTTSNVEGIAENQLAVSINLEIDHSTGRMKTVGGTKDIVVSDTPNIYAAMYDSINGVLLVAYDDKTVHIAAEEGFGESLGVLTGDMYPVCASWEDGLLIATGGKLQYYNGQTLKTIDSSPTAKSVYIRAGRVLITDDANIRYSGVGDEENWTEDTGDPSSSVWVEAGYKDGGKFLGMASLSSDILMIKNNRRVYRLYGEFPDWVIKEVSRNVECSGARAFCSVADSVFILGPNEVQVIETSDFYGDMKPRTVSTLVASEVQKLPREAKVRYLPPLSQVWFIGDGGEVLMYDLAGQAWFKRKFNGSVVDAIPIGDDVLIVKRDRVSQVDESTFYDAGLPLQWKFQAQRLVSQHDYLLKRVQVSVMPFSSMVYAGQITCGAVIVGIPIPDRNIKIWHNYSPIYKNRAKIMLAARSKGIYVSGDKVYNNLELIYGNTRKIFSRYTIIKESRNVFRSKFLELSGHGSMGGFELNGIIMDIAEV